MSKSSLFDIYFDIIESDYLFKKVISNTQFFSLALRHLEFTKQKLTTHLCFVFIGIEQDYSLNAADGVVLFDESKKKQSVNCVDLLMQLIKLRILKSLSPSQIRIFSKQDY